MTCEERYNVATALYTHRVAIWEAGIQSKILLNHTIGDIQVEQLPPDTYTNQEVAAELWHIPASHQQLQPPDLCMSEAKLGRKLDPQPIIYFKHCVT